MDSIWQFIASLFSTCIDLNGVYFVELGEAISLCFIICLLYFAESIFAYFVGSSLLSVVKALVQRFIFPGLKNKCKSSAEADKNKNENKDD